jgi:hypothetical protein
VLAIFLDLTAAFDLTWHFGVLYKLKEYGVTGPCFQYIRSFLEGRKISVRVEGFMSDLEPVERGTPQGFYPLTVAFFYNNQWSTGGSLWLRYGYKSIC